MTLLSAGGISKSFGERTLFCDLSFNINEGDKIGFVGSNGCGKTTLLKLITGELSADSGGFSRKTGLSIGYLEQHACRDSENTAEQEALTVFSHLQELQQKIDKVNISLKTTQSDKLLNEQAALQEEFLGGGGLTYVSRTRATLIGLGFKEGELSHPVSTLSGGERAKIGLAKLLLSEPDLILLDEPTNHLDIDSVEWLEEYLKTSSSAALIISHDRYFLDKLTNRTFELKHKHLVCNNGNYSRHKEIEAERELSLQREYENKTREIKRIEGIIEQQRTFSMERNYRTIDHKQKSIDRIKETLIKPESAEAEVSFNFEIKSDTGNDVLKVAGLSKSFGERTLFSNVDIDIKRGQKVFLLGANGTGKTTLLKELLGNPEVKFGSRVTVGFFDQMQADLPEDKTVFDIIRDEHITLSDTTIRNALASFLFKGDEVFSKIGSLSGGERARVALCRLMLSGDNLLFLDEPTNHLDIRSKEVLEKALMNFGGTLIAVSHDRYFINRLATDILYLEDQKLISYKGGYDDFLSVHQKPAQKTEKPKREMGAGGILYHNKKERQAEIRRLRSATRKYEQEIGVLEGQIAECEAQLSQPEVAEDYKKAMEISERLNELQQKIDEFMLCWDQSLQKLSEMEGDEQ